MRGRVFFNIVVIIGFVLFSIALINLKAKISSHKKVIDEQDETIIKLWESNNKLWGHTTYNYQCIEDLNKSFDKLNKRVHELHRYIHEQSRIQEKLLEKVGKNLDHIKK